MIHAKFDDFDALAAAARGWSIDLRPLEKGPYIGELIQWAAGASLFSYGRFAGTLRQTGDPPPGLRTFVIPAQPDVRFLWRGETVTGDHVLLFPSGGELHALTQSDFEVYTYSVPEAAVDAAARKSGLARTGSFLHGGAIRCPPGTLALLRRSLSELRELIVTGGFAAATPQFAEECNAVLLRLFLEAMECSVNRSAHDPKRLRSQAIWNAETFLDVNRHRSVSVRELSHVTRVSVRTLELAFREELGVSPKRYLRAYRLNGVRRELQRVNGSPVTIAELAGRWGFTHQSQFAADYRQLFGELPSETWGRC